MKHIHRKLTSGFLALCMVFGMLPAVSLGTKAEGTELEAKVTYEQNGFTFEKVSHASSGTETPDGVVDYLGGHEIAPYVDGESELGNADTVQSYSYCAVPYGDWVYMGTMYGALSAATQIKNALPAGTDPAIADAVVNAMYNGKLNRGQEDDGYYAGSVFFKFNIKTGETVILMSRPMYEQGKCDGVPIFRAACEYKGKLYFVGLVSNGTALDKYNGMPLTPAYALNLEIRMQTGVPSIFELNPETDELVKVYEAVDVDGYRALNGNMDKKSVFTSTRAIGTYQDYLIAGGIQLDARYPEGRPDGYAPGDACLVASGNPAEGFKVIATMEDLYDYPAIWRDGSSGGGGIYQVVEYNGSLYVAIVSGTIETRNPVTGQFRPFAVVRGDYDPTVGAIDDRAAWTWTPVIGDPADGAKYTFGIDPARTASSACTLQPYGGYLYIGEYNDVNGSLTGILQRKELNTLAANLEQSINLYRMDENEDIEMVVGDPTEMFPESVSGWGSGYATHMTQYTWMTTVYDGTMYLSTMDETSLTRPIADVVSGEWTKMSPEEWESQLNYLKVLFELLFGAEQDPDPETVVDRAELAASSKFAVRNAKPTKLLTAEQRAQLVADVNSGALVPGCLDNVVDPEIIAALLEGLEELKELMTDFSHEAFIAAYEKLMELRDEIYDKLPDAAKSAIDMLLNYATEENLANLSTCLEYMSVAEAGFDLYAINQYNDGSVQITPVTTNGFNDRYNHGLRIFAATTDYMAIGTANPFYGTQIWRMSAHPTPQEIHEVHVYEEVVVPPTCTERGCTTYTCACGDYYVKNFVDALGHDYVAAVTKEPTEKEDGELTYTCARCEDSYTEVIPAKDCPTAHFTDVEADAWYHEAADWAVSHGLIKGTSETTFSPSVKCNRAMLVTILHRMSGAETVEFENPFTDVKEGSYFYDAVLWAAKNGIVNGKSATTFAPTDALTREQAVTILYRYYIKTEMSKVEPVALVEDTEASDVLAGYPDCDKVSGYAREAMAWAVTAKLILGDPIGDVDMLDPQGTTTRAQLTVILMRYDAMLQN